MKNEKSQWILQKQKYKKIIRECYEQLHGFFECWESYQKSPKYCPLHRWAISFESFGDYLKYQWMILFPELLHTKCHADAFVYELQFPEHIIQKSQYFPSYSVDRHSYNNFFFFVLSISLLYPLTSDFLYLCISYEFLFFYCFVSSSCAINTWSFTTCFVNCMFFLIYGR